MSFDLQIRPIWSWTKDMEETSNLKESSLFLANNLLVEGQTQSKTNRLLETDENWNWVSLTSGITISRHALEGAAEALVPG